jgi:nitroreductase
MLHPPNPAALNFLAGRRSYPAKTYSGAVPDTGQLQQILTIALRVPDHGALMPWRLLVLQRPALLRIGALAAAHGQALGLDETAIAKGRGQFDRSHLAVVVLSCPIAAHKVPVAEQIASAAALCMNILHASTAAGWAAQWLTGWVAHDPAFASAAFDAQPGQTVSGIIHIGTASAPMDDRPRPDPSRVIRWVEE